MDEINFVLTWRGIWKESEILDKISNFETFRTWFAQSKICNEVINRREIPIVKFQSNYKLEEGVSLFFAPSTHHSSFKRSGYHFRIKDHVLGATKKSPLTCVILASRAGGMWFLYNYFIRLFHSICEEIFLQVWSAEVRTFFNFPTLSFQLKLQRSIMYLIRGWSKKVCAFHCKFHWAVHILGKLKRKEFFQGVCW